MTFFTGKSIQKGFLRLLDHPHLVYKLVGFLHLKSFVFDFLVSSCQLSF